MGWPRRRGSRGPCRRSGSTSLGSDGFRYWTAVEALERAAGFWASILPAGTRWFMGASLPVSLDSGLDLNAYYDRSELAFFHEVVKRHHRLQRRESRHRRPRARPRGAGCDPPAVMGRGRRRTGGVSRGLWRHQRDLLALQLESLRKAVLLETEGKLYRNSRLSRVAEQLGWAIRQRHPDAVDSDSLRNAVNSFFYRDPQTLPPRAPASMLSSEPHSFARVFVGAFFEALAGMVPAPATSDGPARDRHGRRAAARRRDLRGADRARLLQSDRGAHAGGGSRAVPGQVSRTVEGARSCVTACCRWNRRSA